MVRRASTAARAYLSPIIGNHYTVLRLVIIWGAIAGLSWWLNEVSGRVAVVGLRCATHFDARLHGASEADSNSIEKEASVVGADPSAFQRGHRREARGNRTLRCLAAALDVGGIFGASTKHASAPPLVNRREFFVISRTASQVPVGPSSSL